MPERDGGDFEEEDRLHAAPGLPPREPRAFEIALEGLVLRARRERADDDVVVAGFVGAEERVEGGRDLIGW